jgi:hypothetical protein
MIPVSQPLVAAEFLHDNYRDSIMPWCVVQLLPDAQRRTIARFRKRNDATAHLQALQRLMPESVYEIVFIPPEKVAGDRPSKH